MHIDKLANIVKRCKNTHHRITKMKPVDVSLSLDTDFAVENKSKDTKFKVVDYVKI